MKDKKSASLFQKEQVMESLKQSFVKLDPRVMIKNPIMFTVELVTLVMLVVCILSLGTTEYGTFGYNFLVFVVLFVTLLFANFAEAIAEARGKAQADSLRKTRPRAISFVDGGTATDEMLDFLAECLRYGISICVAGATSSGKTTLAGWLLTTIPDNKRIFTIENGSRELALVREKDGKVTNSVIHTLTRFSENEKQNIDQDMLLDMALRFIFV